jgi:hypothetical protein
LVNESIVRYRSAPYFALPAFYSGATVIDFDIAQANLLANSCFFGTLSWKSEATLSIE